MKEKDRMKEKETVLMKKCPKCGVWRKDPCSCTLKITIFKEREVTKDKDKRDKWILLNTDIFGEDGKKWRQNWFNNVTSTT